MKYVFIGWCKEDNHDKVWGIIELQSTPRLGSATFLTVWGRRGRKLQAKVSTDTKYEIMKLIDAKLDKGYRAIDVHELAEVYPEFRSDLEKTAIWATLKL